MEFDNEHLKKKMKNAIFRAMNEEGMGIKSEEERIDYLKKCFETFMSIECVMNNNISLLSDLYEFVFPENNNALLEIMGSERMTHLGITPQETVFMDMILALSDRIEYDNGLAEKFINIVSPRYKNDYEFITEITLDQYKYFTAEEDDDTKISKKSIIKLQNDMDKVSRMISGRESKTFFLLFVYCYYVNFEESFLPMGAMDDFFDEYLMGYDAYENYLSDVNYNISKKTDWTDNILYSVTFEKYITRQVDNLAKSRSLSVEKLFDFLSAELYSKNNFYYISGILKNYGLNINPLAKVWDDKIEIDIEKHINEFYINEFCKYWDENHHEYREITKMDILRYMPQRDYEKDYHTISNSLFVHTILIMYKKLLKEYYKNFSFDKINNKPLKERYAYIIKEYEQTLEHQRTIFKRVNDENIKLKTLLMKKDFAVGQKEYIKDLEKQLKEKEEEINNLKKTSLKKDEYIELLLQDEPKVVDEYDFYMLQSKKYLFVGRDDKFVQDIKKKFPGSIFMTTSTMNIDNLKVDAIVYLIKNMSHSMFYKVSSKKSLGDIKVIYCNSRNEKALYSVMYEKMK